MVKHHLKQLWYLASLPFLLLLFSITVFADGGTPELAGIAENLTDRGYAARIIEPGNETDTVISLDKGRYEIQLNVPVDSFTDEVVFFAKAGPQENLNDRQAALLSAWENDTEKSSVIFDMGFMDASGNEVEPAGFVGIRLVTDVRQILTEQKILADLGTELSDGIALAVEDGEIAVDVVHINEQRYTEETVELVASTQTMDHDIENAESAVTVADGIVTASFSTDSFSTIVLAAGTSLASGNTYYLTSDITRNFYAYTGGTINLYLNGYTLTGPGNSSVIEVGSGTTLNLYDSYDGRTGGIITGGNRDWGGGIGVYSSGTVNLYSGTITGNSAKYGAGIYINGGTVNVSGGTITDNTAAQNGGGINIYSGALTISGGTVSENSALWGGGVYISNTGLTVSMTGGTISGNSATNAGGGVYVAATSALNMSGGKISGNTAGNGGGILAYNSVLNLSDGTISGNTANYGGGINIEASGKTSTLNGATISGNTANQYGGGVYVSSDSTFQMSSGSITENGAAKGGGGIHVYNATVNLTGGTVNNNTAKFGAGLYIEANEKTSTAAGTAIFGNTATGSGGGAYVQAGATLSVSSSVLSGNKANYGGCIYLDAASIVLSGSGQLKNSEASYHGGGIYAAANSTLTVSGGSVSGNSAKNGGGLYLYNATDALLSGGQIENNTATAQGGGIRVENSVVRVSAAVRVTGNTGSAGNDVYLGSDDRITISGALASGFSMGIAEADGTGIFTSGWSSYMNTDPEDYFSGDSDAYIVVLNSGEAKLTGKYNVISKSKMVAAKTVLTLGSATSLSRGTGTLADVQSKSGVQDIGEEAGRIYLWTEGSSAFWWADTASVYLPVDASELFKDLGALESLDLSGFDASHTTNASRLFQNCSSLTTLDLSPLDTGNVTDMSYLFASCSGLTALNLSKLDTGSVTNMRGIFSKCSGLTSLDLHMLDTSHVTSMLDMFTNCTALESVNLTGLDVHSVENMGLMFAYCENLAAVDLSGLNASSVTNMNAMFSGCKNLRSVNFSSFTTRDLTTMNVMFNNCAMLETVDLSGFHTSNLRYIDSMFNGCTSLRAVNLNGFNTSGVEYMYNVFCGCESLTALDISSFQTASATNMDSLFRDCSSLQTLNLGNFNTSNVTSMRYMFLGCTSLKSLDLSGFDTGKTANMTMLMFGCAGLERLTVPANFVCGSAITDASKKPTLPEQLLYVEDASGNTVLLDSGSALDVVTQKTTYVSAPSAVTVTFYSGSTVLGSQTFTPGVSQNLLTSCQGSVDGYSFYGWAASSGTQARRYTSGQSASFSEATNLYAIYSRPITFYSGIARGIVNTVTQYYYSGEAKTITTPTITVPNSTWTAFGWWNGTEATNSSSRGENQEFMPAATTYYAVCYRLLTIQYDGNGATGSTSDTSKAQFYNSYGTLSTPSFTLASNGYTVPANKRFAYWGEAANAPSGFAAQSSYEGFTPGLSATELTKTLFAIWEATHYIVAFETNGGDAIELQTVRAGSGIALPAATKAGYFFEGWFADSTLQTAVGAANEPYTPTADITLYASFLRVFQVTVPATLPVSVAADGTVSIANDARITNNSSDAVKVTGVSIQNISGSGWTYQETLDLTTIPVNAKVFSLSVTPPGEIAQGEQKAVSYRAVIPTQSEAVNTASIAQVIFTVDWVGDDP